MKLRIIKNFQEDYLVLLVELILRIAAGNKQIEQQLTNTVIADLESLKSKRDIFFINKVLLPLIKNEEVMTFIKGPTGNMLIRKQIAPNRRATINK